MTDPKKPIPSWLEVVSSAVPPVFLAVLLVLLATIVIIAFVDHRIEQAEDRMLDVPPSAWEPPVLEEYAVGEVDVAALPRRQWVYVPVYSHVYHQGGAPFALETMLSVRNIDPDHAIFLSAVEYYDTSGQLTRTCLEQAVKLKPLQTIEFLVERRDSSGGSGANFLVEWRGHPENEKPLIEAIMVGSSGYRAFGFARSGVEIGAPDNGQVEAPQ